MIKNNAPAGGVTFNIIEIVAFRSQYKKTISWFRLALKFIAYK